MSDTDRHDAERADRVAIDPELSTRPASAQATPGTAAAQQVPGPDLAASRAVGYETALGLVTAQADAGMDTDRISDREHDLAAEVLSGARGPNGIAFAREYDMTAATLVADLRDLDRPGAPEPASVRYGTPHAESRLAGRSRQADREAG